MTPEHKKIYKMIDSILWNDWDPIGVNEFESTRDEYRSYIPIFLGLILRKASVKEIADQLTYICTETIGLFYNRRIDLQVAEKLHDLEKLVSNRDDS